MQGKKIAFEPLHVNYDPFHKKDYNDIAMYLIHKHLKLRLDIMLSMSMREKAREIRVFSNHAKLTALAMWHACKANCKTQNHSPKAQVQKTPFY